MRPAREATLDAEEEGDVVRVTGESATPPGGAPRTVLEQRIRERRQTFEEFASYAEVFARQHGEAGTLSLRHLQRLVAGGGTASRLRPATARLLERIFDDDIGHLLSVPGPSPENSGSAGPGVPHALSVAVAAVVKDSQVLLVSRREVAGNSDLLWQFPAGMVKPGAASHAVAVAETLAETGVHCMHRRYLGRRLHPATHVFCDYHLCEFISGHASNLDAAENSGVAWVDTSQLSRLIALEVIYPPILEALGLTSLCAVKSD